MRIYLPASASDLLAPELGPRAVRVASPQWVAQCEGDVELAEHLAHKLAAMDAVAVSPAGEARVVISADVPDAHVREGVESSAELLAPVAWKNVACFHVDDAGLVATVDRARTGDEAAAQELWEEELLWFDASEKGLLVSELGI